MLLFVLLSAAPARAETSADSGVPPVCAAPDYDYWVSHVGDYDDDIEGSTESDIRLHVDFQVGVGASLECAFQSRPKGHPVCTGPGGSPPCTTAYEYVPNIPVTAFPDTIDAAGGDHQNVHISAPGTTLGYEESGARVGWGSCFPGATYQPGFCDPALFKFEPGGFPVSGAQMLYRFRDETGHFRGRWTLSYGKLSPGFRLEHTAMAPCDRFASSCDYDVIFNRDHLGKPEVGRDAQVLLLLPSVHSGVYPEDAAPSAAVPFLVIQSAGGDASGGNGTPGNGGGGAAGPPSPPVAPRAAKVGFAGKAPKLAKLAAAGKLTVTVPVTEAGVKVAGVLSVGVAEAKSLGLKSAKGTPKIGAGSATAARPGMLRLTLRLTGDAKAAFARAAGRRSGIAAVKASLALTLSKTGVAAQPLVKPLVFRR